MKAFLQRYVEVFSEAERTGDTTAYRSLSHNCDACDQIADQIDEVYAAGGRIQSQPSKFTGWSIDEDGVRDGAACILTYTAAPTTWTRKAGAKPETFPGGPSEEALQLTWLDGEWRIASLTILNPQG